MMESWPDVNDFILVVKRKDFVALARIVHEAKAVVDEPHIANKTVELQKCVALAESIQDHLIKVTHGSIAYEATNDIRELLDEVSGCNATNWSAVDSDFPFDPQPIHKKLQNPFGIKLLLFRRQIGREYALLWFAIPTIVPNKNVAISPQEEV